MYAGDVAEVAWTAASWPQIAAEIRLDNVNPTAHKPSVNAPRPRVAKWDGVVTKLFDGPLTNVVE
jgi:hypothetical protein